MDELFYEIHNDLPREGPGDNESTLRAFRMLDKLPGNARLLDIGCGPGMQTVQLAKALNGTITALDNHQPFLDQLKASACREKVLDKITIVNGSMFEMSFPPRSFDIIWSEGAIFIIGFERGLKEWKKYLKNGGYLVVSELSWLRQDGPPEVKEFFQREYPVMLPVSQNLKIIEDAGYSPIGSFVLPESSWWDNYYLPIEKKMKQLPRKYPGSAEMKQFIDMHREEIEMYREYSAYYGNVFFIMQAY